MANSQKVKVGIFVVVGTLLLITALYFIGQKQFLFSKNIQLISNFENVSGLKLGNNVRYSGVNIGTVSKIEMQEVGKIRVEMSVESGTADFINKDALASISSDGLVGSMVINIVPGKNKQAKKVVSGDTIQSVNKIGMDEILETLNKTNENAAILSSDLLVITNRILEGKGTFATLINDTLMANDINRTIQELKKSAQGTTMAISKVNAIISKINYDESAAAVILSDKNAAKQIKQVFDNLEKSTQDINAVTKNMDDYIKEIKTGKGAINQLTQDEDLVKEIDETVLNIKEAAEKLNENMEALKHNFLFRGYFKRLERKEKKEARRN